ADLGIAKSTSDGNQGDLTAPEILIGTPAYVSPEQAQNAQSVDRRADIYSLGVSMYEMLAGEKPYKGSSTIEIINQLFNAPVPDIRAKNPVVSGGTAQLIMEMMSKDREMRPADWGVFCQRAKELLESLKTGQCADLAAVKKTKWFRKKL
ncbi:MAG: protein kinase, partial [Victivallaceae bacterium]